MTQLRVLASDLTMPPMEVEEGSAYIVPEGAGAAWGGKHDQVAVRSNGGWAFLTPVAGWRAWHVAAAMPLVFDGRAWVSAAVAVSRGGATTRHEILEFDQELPVGEHLMTDRTIPSHCLVVGVTARVLEELTGPLTGWRLGVAGDESRYGHGLGLSVGSYLRGLSGSPVAYYDEVSLRVGAEGGGFTGGVIRIALHVMRVTPPRIG